MPNLGPTFDLREDPTVDLRIAQQIGGAIGQFAGIRIAEQRRHDLDAKVVEVSKRAVAEKWTPQQVLDAYTQIGNWDRSVRAKMEVENAYKRMNNQYGELEDVTLPNGEVVKAQKNQANNKYEMFGGTPLYRPDNGLVQVYDEATKQMVWKPRSEAAGFTSKAPIVEKPKFLKNKNGTWSKFNPQTNSMEHVPGQPEIAYGEPYEVEDENGRIIRVQKTPEGREVKIDAYTEPAEYDEPTVIEGAGGKVTVQRNKQTGKLEVISTEKQQKTDDESKRLLYWQAVEYNALQENPPDTETADYARGKIRGLKTKQPTTSTPSEVKTAETPISTEDVRMQTAPDMRLNTYWPKLSNKQKLDILNALNKNPDSITAILERLKNVSSK